METRRWMELEMDLVALDRASESVSSSQASNPCTAASWAIPDPIWPPPTTAMVLISAIHAPLPPWQNVRWNDSVSGCVYVCVSRVRARVRIGSGEEVLGLWIGPGQSLLNRKGMSQGLGTWFGLIRFGKIGPSSSLFIFCLNL